MSTEPESIGAEPAPPPRPFDLLTETSDRLAVACVLFVVAFFLAWLAAPPSTGFPILDVSFAVAVASAITVFTASRMFRDRPARIVDLALAFEVVASLSIGLAEQWWPWPEDATVRGVSWICVVLVTFPFTIPSSPRRTLVASLVSASMAPVALCLVIVLRANPMPSGEVMSALFLPIYLCAGLAYVLARIVDRIGKDADARTKMGSYRLVERLGKGGMGEVWRAEHAMIGRPAAVKFVHPEVVSAELGEDPYTVFRRFEREAKATSRLTSPHTVSLFDFGYAASGAFYYVMELLDGQDLDTLIRRFGPLPAERATHLLTQVCASLAEAHDAGLVHRDIKPANIYVCRMGVTFDFVKVLDFGLVVSSESAKEQLTRLTNDGLTSGTPAFMAPETASGAELDARADIYGLGCVAYWILTGRNVFESTSPMRILADHVQTQPAPPSSRTEMPIPEDLEQLVLACLEKHPDHRPATARELAERLGALTFETPWTPVRAEKWWTTNLPDAGE